MKGFSLVKGVLAASVIFSVACANDMMPPMPPEFDGTTDTPVNGADDATVATTVGATLLAQQVWQVNGYFYKSGDGQWDYKYCDLASSLCFPLLGAADDGAFKYDFQNTSALSQMSGDPYGYYIQYDLSDTFGWALAIPSSEFLVKLKGASADRSAMEYNTDLNKKANFSISADKRSVTFKN